MNVRNLSYALTCLSFAVIIGGGVYEHIAVWPAAFAELPKSLAIFQGVYKLNAAPFWMMVHPVTLLLFVITFVANRKTKRKANILIPMIAYLLILVVTAIYFVPELMKLTGTPYAETVDESLQSRGSVWINLSLVRLAVLLVSAAVLNLGLTKPETDVAPAKKQPSYTDDARDGQTTMSIG